MDYQDGIHIDKLHGVISQELQNALVVFEVSDKTPSKWEDYLELLLTSLMTCDFVTESVAWLAPCASILPSLYKSFKIATT